MLNLHKNILALFVVFRNFDWSYYLKLNTVYFYIVSSGQETGNSLTLHVALACKIVVETCEVKKLILF